MKTRSVIKTNKAILEAMLREQNKRYRDGKIVYVACGTCKVKSCCANQPNASYTGLRIGNND